MGRQAYLDKIAFGRSAFEPAGTAGASQDRGDEELAAQSAEPAKRDTTASMPVPQDQANTSPSLSPSREQEHGTVARLNASRSTTETPNNGYVQLYDERGYPMNPQSKNYGRSLRDAQNDVLASVGVVKRHLPPSGGIAEFDAEQLELLEEEDAVGNIIGVTFSIIRIASTWWIGSLRERIVTFRYPTDTHFSSIVEAECAASGPSILYAGLAPYVFRVMSIKAIYQGIEIFQPIDRLLYWTQATARTRIFFRRCRPILSFFAPLALEILFYPFSYRSTLEDLGLVPATSLSVLWNSSSPYSTALSLRPFSLSDGASTSFMSFTKAIFSNPLFFVCTERIVMRWVYNRVSLAFDSIVQQQSSSSVKDMLNALVSLGRKMPLTEESSSSRDDTSGSYPPTVEAGSADSTGTTGRAAAMDANWSQRDELHHHEIGSNHDFNGVTQDRSGEDLAAGSSEAAGIEGRDSALDPTSPDNRHLESEVPPTFELMEPIPDSTLAPPPSPALSAVGHETLLSSLSTDLISDICKEQLVGILMLPLGMMRTRMVASHHLGNQSRPISPLVGLVGNQVSHAALCSMLEVSIELLVWGAQYVAVIQAGKRFGWGQSV